MPKGVDWSKDMALELIKAGFFQLAKKHHPDAGGNHEKMLTLGATKEHLEGMLNGGAGSWKASYEQPKEEKPKKSTNKGKTTFYDGAPPGMFKYAFGWWMIANVEIIRESEKAVQFDHEDFTEPIWLPKSQLHKNANQVWETGDIGDIVFSEWIARQKGWV